MAKAPPPRFERKTADARRASLVAAATQCLARDGITGFTVDNISAEAGVSRGLINHHFGGVEGLLIAVYTDMTAAMEAAGRTLLLTDGGGEARLSAVVSTMFQPPMFTKASLRAWLALWAEVAVNPKLRAAHRTSYSRYRAALVSAIGDVAAARGLQIDAQALATTAIALIDGLWIQWCLDPSVIAPEGARQCVYETIEARLGKLHR